MPLFGSVAESLSADKRFVKKHNNIYISDEQLNILKAYNINIDNYKNLNELLWALQKFLVQRLVYNAKTKNYNKVCDNLLDETKNPVIYLQQYNQNEVMGLGEYPVGLKKLR